MSLSQRFAKLKAPVASVGAPAGRKQKQNAQKVTNTAKRSNVMANKRGLAQVAIKKVGKKVANAPGKKGPKGVKVGKPIITKGRKGKAGGKGGKKDEAKNDPVSLDKAMDAYWFKAGKGPDPEQAALDRQMDSYFKSKPAAAVAEEMTT